GAGAVERSQARGQGAPARAARAPAARRRAAPRLSRAALRPERASRSEALLFCVRSGAGEASNASRPKAIVRIPWRPSRSTQLVGLVARLGAIAPRAGAALAEQLEHLRAQPAAGRVGGEALVPEQADIE